MFKLSWPLKLLISSNELIKWHSKDNEFNYKTYNRILRGINFMVNVIKIKKNKQLMLKF